MEHAREARMKIGDVAKTVGLTVKTIRYYELQRLLDEPKRTESGYRIYGQKDVQRLEFIKQAKRLGLSLDEIHDVLVLHGEKQAPCVHVLALMDQKLERVDTVMRELDEFRKEMLRLRTESQVRLDQLPEGAQVCGIIERGIHAKGEYALTWLAGQRKG